jgi:hypothetical protein
MTPEERMAKLYREFISKKTAVQWLEEKYYTTNGQLIGTDFEEAEEMEKEQMESAYFNGSCDRMNDEGSFEQYYKETYE